jgi:hypothetical protein
VWIKEDPQSDLKKERFKIFQLERRCFQGQSHMKTNMYAMVHASNKAHFSSAFVGVERAVLIQQGFQKKCQIKSDEEFYQ